MLYAFENGYDEVDYCGSRPVLSDGIFQMKRRWGASVFDGWSRDTLFVRPRRMSAASLAFLARNPFIAREAGGLAGRVFCADAATADDVARAEQVCASDGIREIRIDSLQAPAPGALEAAAAAPRIRIVDLSREADAAAAYCRP